MIKLKDLLYEISSEISSLNLLIARRVEGRTEKYIQAKIKQYIKDKNVGNFDISGLGLTTLPALLKNLKIGKSFDCGYNRLDSLVGAPTGVGGKFDCRYNILTSLVGAPVSVGLDFFCGFNQLDSLVGAPTSVGGSFNCSNNVVKFTEEQVRAVCDVKGNIHV